MKTIVVGGGGGGGGGCRLTLRPQPLRGCTESFPCDLPGPSLEIHVLVQRISMVKGSKKKAWPNCLDEGLESRKKCV